MEERVAAATRWSAAAAAPGLVALGAGLWSLGGGGDGAAVVAAVAGLLCAATLGVWGWWVQRHRLWERLPTAVRGGISLLVLLLLGLVWLL
jgi:hypothetical protein